MAVQKMLEKKWELRGTVLSMDIAASSSETQVQTNTRLSGRNSGLIAEFLSQSGIAATIIGMLTLSPFQSLIFQSLTVEEGAKGVQTLQIAPGIALFLELGIKAERILKLLRQAKISTPLVEAQIGEIASSPEARASAFESMGMNYDDFKKSQEYQDSENIVNYVSEYYQRYGGLDRPNGHLTIDHWVGYLSVAQNQQTIRGALNNASEFSPKFRDIRQHYNPLPDLEPETIAGGSPKSHSKIFIQLASATKALKERSNDMYDEILSTFVYQLTDRDMCCLVQIFGTIANPDSMYTIASLLRILATNLGGEIVRLQNIFCRFLSNLAQDALFELIAGINKFYYRLVEKITKAFTTDLTNITACNGMFTLGWAILHSVRVLFEEVNALMRELSSIIGDFGSARSGSWQVSADRRHLLGMARILEVLAARFDLANTCERDAPNRRTVTQNSNSPEFDQAIFTIIGSVPPTLQISEEDKATYFADIQPRTSSALKFAYGIGSEQNNESSFGNCYTPDQKEKIENLIKNLTAALQND
jgi:hypothetical protein